MTSSGGVGGFWKHFHWQARTSGYPYEPSLNNSKWYIKLKGLFSFCYRFVTDLLHVHNLFTIFRIHELVRTVDESEICIHLAHLLQLDYRHALWPNSSNFHLQTVRQCSGYSIRQVSFDSCNVHGMNGMNKNEHFFRSVYDNPKLPGMVEMVSWSGPSNFSIVRMSINNVREFKSIRHKVTLWYQVLYTHAPETCQGARLFKPQWALISQKFYPIW